MVTATQYRSTALPDPAQLEAVAAIYETIAAGRVAPRSHTLIRPAAWKLITAIRKLADTAEPDGYLSSERRLEAVEKLVTDAGSFSFLIAEVIGDELSPLHAANEARDLLAEYEEGCELADAGLRASIHDSLRHAA